MPHYEVMLESLDLQTATAAGDALEATWGIDPDGVALDEIAPDRWRLIAYFQDAPDMAAIATALAPILTDTNAAPVLTKGKDADWVVESLRELKPIHAGRFVVHGSHDRDAVAPGAIGIEIDAGIAFGTGHHGTTAGCLQAIDALARQGVRPKRAVDLGTGSGVLAIAVAKAMRTPVLASDIDVDAVTVAQANARRNQTALVTAHHATGANSARLRAAAPFDLVIANILANPLVRLAADVQKITAPGGAVILSGLLDHQAPRIRAVYEGHGFACVARIRLDGWSTLVMAKP